MKVKRFIAEDMRTALRDVKEELGADAVILSSRKLDNQVEILAAMDYDEHLINRALDDTRIEQKPGCLFRTSRRRALFCNTGSGCT